MDQGSCESGGRVNGRRERANVIFHLWRCLVDVGTRHRGRLKVLLDERLQVEIAPAAQGCIARDNHVGRPPCGLASAKCASSRRRSLPSARRLKERPEVVGGVMSLCRGGGGRRGLRR